MKLLPILLLAATCAFTHSGQAQANFDSPSSGIRRPTPTPGPGVASAADLKKPFEASLSSDAKAKSSDKSVTSFSSSTEKIYVHFFDNATKGDKIQVTWVALDAKPYPKNKKVTSNSSVMPGPGTIGSYYLPAKDLPVGKYAAQVTINGKPVKTLNFTVTK